MIMTFLLILFFHIQMRLTLSFRYFLSYVLRWNQPIICCSMFGFDVLPI